MTKAVSKVFWRISNHITLDGNGGKKSGARWHSTGKRIVYLADSPMSAIVETLVHLDIDGEDTPDFYPMLKVEAPGGLTIQPLAIADSDNWRQNLALTQRTGDAWLVSAQAALARVPSAIAPHTWNYLLNPEHPDAKQIQIVEVIQERFDNRLFRLGSR